MKKLHFLNKTKITLFLAALVSLTACSDDDNPPVVEEEVITTVIVTLTAAGQQDVILTYTDLDGEDGPEEPDTVVTGNFVSNTTYNGSIEILNETEDPVEDITEEIAQKDLEHQFFYQVPNSLGSFSYVDFDSNGKPLGLEFDYLTGNAGTGSLTITLRHLLNKNADGVSAGNIANAGGSTDIEVTFPITVN
ncbi:type 1 periplasmic binding fold superfamily protein [Flavobacterium sp.]|jgi:hypothetical protein|uniref:type 1 periplasmic binding fold superfamily protein n=1 Tax=Flavobacterium sp. TaxID=239 RepID=UPI0037C04B23